MVNACCRKNPGIRFFCNGAFFLQAQIMDGVDWRAVLRFLGTVYGVDTGL